MVEIDVNSLEGADLSDAVHLNHITSTAGDGNEIKFLWKTLEGGEKATISEHFEPGVV